VSRDELANTSNPRKFSLQRLVEVADLNMERIRYVWSKIWSLLSEHFIFVGSHVNLMVAIYAIDSLRQLADKFLLMEAFQSFNFQKEFLKPFETIMLNNLHTRSDIKDYIVMCIANICGSKTQFIKSGWSVIINIFTLAAQDQEEHLVVQSFDALSAAVSKHFELVEQGFVELINCLNKYTRNTMF
jgi:brefeldin A-inhibited guanine nucleotide-exchange protein